MEDLEEALQMYRLTPAPPKENDLQVYIDRYLAENDSKYLAWFLHYYERTVNEKAMSIARDYAIIEHFPDIKQAYIVGIVKALTDYDPKRGVPFIVYKERAAMREVYEYLRTARTELSIPSNDEYRLLRKIMRLYNESGKRYDRDTVRKISEQVKVSEKTVREMIQAGLRSMQVEDYYRAYADEDSEETREEIACDSSSGTEDLYFRLEQANAVMEAFERLNYRERAVVAAHLGFCTECYSVFPKGQPFIDIAIDHGLSSPDTADKTFRAALKKMKEELNAYGIHKA